MKILLATILFMVFSASVWAQGEIGVYLQMAPFGDTSPKVLPDSANWEASDWLPPFQRFPVTSDYLVLLESSREQSRNGGVLQAIIPPSPLQNSSSLFQSSSFVLMSIDSFYNQPIAPSVGGSTFQASSLTIQPAPEPSTVALGGLAIVLIALTRLSKRQQVLKR